MHRTLSVKECLTFSGLIDATSSFLLPLTVKPQTALLRLPNSERLKEKHAVVNRVLDQLGLQEVRHSIIGDEEKRGISGGQRKRVNIGIEMVAQPSLLMLDEPTSGLDSTTSNEVRNLFLKSWGSRLILSVFTSWFST